MEVLPREAIHLGLAAGSKEDAILATGRILEELGAVDTGYADASHRSWGEGYLEDKAVTPHSHTGLLAHPGNCKEMVWTGSYPIPLSEWVKCSVVATS